MLTLPDILITNTISEDESAPLAGKANLIMGPSDGSLMKRAQVLEHAPNLVGIINQGELVVDEELISLAPKLEIVASVALGTDNINLPLLEQEGIWATNAPTAFVDATADFTMGLIIGITRKIREADAFVRSGNWKSFEPGLWDGSILRDKTLGIIGYGRIGKAVAKRAKAFGMHVIYNRRRFEESSGYRKLEDLLHKADIITLHTPLNDDSHRLIDRDAIKLMKKGAYLINVSRGKVIDEHALVDALKARHLKGAALDVFENEPHVHPDLIQLSNVILTPHIGGGTREGRFHARHLCAQNVALVLKGKRPLISANNPPHPKNFRQRDKVGDV